MIMHELDNCLRIILNQEALFIRIYGFRLLDTYALFILNFKTKTWIFKDLMNENLILIKKRVV